MLFSLFMNPFQVFKNFLMLVNVSFYWGIIIVLIFYRGFLLAYGKGLFVGGVKGFCLLKILMFLMLLRGLFWIVG